MTARGYHIWALVLGLAALAGCQNTWMLLHVRAPGDADLSDTNVRLIRDGEPVLDVGGLPHRPHAPARHGALEAEGADAQAVRSVHPRVRPSRAGEP